LYPTNSIVNSLDHQPIPNTVFSAAKIELRKGWISVLGISKKKQYVEKAIAILDCVVIKRGKEQNSFLLSPPKWISNYNNRYVWEFIVIDIIYSLLRGFSFATEIRFNQYSELLKDIKGYKTCNLKRDGNNLTNIFYSNEGVKKDILVELKKGMDIWSYDGLVSFYGVNSKISDECILDTAILDASVLKIEPCNDGNALLIRISEKIITEQHLYKSLVDILSAYGISLESEL
jgi:hypothetical protein